MLLNYVFSADGHRLLADFRNKFGCSFRIEEPSGSSVIMDFDNYSYAISKDLSVQEFIDLVSESIRIGKNLLQFKGDKIKYDDDAVY